ncbi:hypothetical protein DOM21_11765 [Bacteriovorax stolpii]|uniref:DUF1176 domain-containing protein n=1 Tax=Bacteriovorax stolpii TaxID=960 RepID=UPI00115985B2|nr:DUF1176 domain-containing protein [Bacteriovorax stolpii]QDK42112.1 hypothetical protein DOM21_11765 [Bacteriovorax stolpii]
MKMKSLFALALTLSAVTAFAGEITIPKEVLDRHTNACPEFASNEYLQREAYQLPGSEYSPKGATLYVLGCEMYAYNSLEKAYIVSPWGEVTNVAVAEVAADGSIMATSDLMGAGYDAETKTLGTFQKGRGMGDCGSSATYQYSPENQRFVLIEARVKDSCDGEFESEWPVVYKK